MKKNIREPPLAKIDSSPSMHVSDTSSDNLVNSEKSKKLAQIEQNSKYKSNEKELKPYAPNSEP